MKVARCGIKTKAERVNGGGSKSEMKKASKDRIRVGYEGCEESNEKVKDYNHYRSISKALKGTNDRAISIVTGDIYEELNRMGGKLEIGDLGENITIDNLEYNELKVGSKLKMGNVKIEITELCVPCARLGNQKWAESLGGKQWWNQKKVKTEISELINRKGGRGWYCKVIKEGVINIDDDVRMIIKIVNNKTC